MVLCRMEVLLVAIMTLSLSGAKLINKFDENYIISPSEADIRN